MFAELDGVEVLYLIDVTSGAVTELPAENSSLGVAYIDSTAIYPDYSPTLTCPPVYGGSQGMGPYPTTECGSSGYCIDFTWPDGVGQCATACLTDNDCPQDYECKIFPNHPAGACEISDDVVPPGTYPDAPYYPVYGFGLFTSPGLAVNPKWSALASNLEAVRVFHTADCGRPGGWDNDGAPYITRYYTKTNGGVTAPATSSYLTGTVRVFSTDGFRKPLILGHEYGHLIIQADRDGDHIVLAWPPGDLRRSQPTGTSSTWVG